jgi:RND family efflux transporter MFP subunit
MCIVIAVLISGVLLSSCSETRPISAASTSGAPPSVAVAKVRRTDLSRNLELAAEFRPWQEIDVHAKVSGFVKGIYVDVGDRVRTGQLIAELEAPEMKEEIAQAGSVLKRAELEVERARSELRRAEANLKLHETSFKRLTAVMEARPKLVAQQELDSYTARYRESEAQHSAAKAAVAASEQQVLALKSNGARLNTMAAYLRITAPFSGIITKRSVDPGAMVQAGTASHTQALPVVRLSQVDHLRLVLPVPESIAARVRTGAPVEVRVDSLRRVFQGRISRFTSRLEPTTRTMETEVDIPNPGMALMPGMYGYASLRLERREDVLALPVQAVRGEAATVPVLVVANGKVEQRKVDVGLRTSDWVEIRAGLSENDLVVIGNTGHLKPGMAVTPRPVSEHARAD